MGGQSELTPALLSIALSISLIGEAERNPDELGRGRKLGPKGGPEGLMKMPERLSEHFDGAGARAHDGVERFGARQQDLKKTVVHADRIEGMGDAGNRESGGEGEAPAQFHQEGHEKGEIAMVHDVDGSGREFLEEAGLRGGLHALSHFGGEQLIQIAVKLSLPMGVLAEEMIAVKGPVGEQGFEKFLVGYGHAHLILPEGIAQEKRIEAPPSHKGFNPSSIPVKDRKLHLCGSGFPAANDARVAAGKPLPHGLISQEGFRKRWISTSMSIIAGNSWLSRWPTATAAVFPEAPAGTQGLRRG